MLGSAGEILDIVEQYEALIAEKRYDQALPIIEDLVGRAPHIATSWFNWGACLDGLKRHAEAADKFLQAFRLDPEDYRKQYRVFRSLFLANDFDRFCAFARSESERIPEVFDILKEQEEFAAFVKREEFQILSKSGAA
jgi:tetratricopeptide (TPR) repeat protein